MAQTFRKISYCVSHHSHRGDAKREFARIDLIERVGLSVVNIEVVRSIDIQTRPNHSFTRYWTNIRAAAGRSNAISTDAREKFRDLLKVRTHLQRSRLGKSKTFRSIHS